MSQPAERPAIVYRKNRVPPCFCTKCIEADPARALLLRQALTGKRISELRQPRPRR